MSTVKCTNEEKNTKRVILLSSTFIVFIVSIVLGYILINAEIKDFQNHLKTFKKTLIEREKSAIKAVVDNLIIDIQYAENSKLNEIKQRVKNQTIILNELIINLLSEYRDKKTTLNVLKKHIKSISKNNNLEVFIFSTQGKLIFNQYSTLVNGTNYIDLVDINGENFIQQIVEKNGFVNYLWFVPKSNKISKKITYSILIKELDIVIGFAEFLDTHYSLNKKIVNKISKEQFNKNDFMFIFEIMSLSSSKNYSKLILEKNIITDERELSAIENILAKSNYKGNIFYEYDNKLTYSSFLYDDRTFISAGLNLNSIKNILEKEEQISHINLNKKIISLILNIILIAIAFFIISYFLAQKIEKIFINYRLKIEYSQQLLLEKSKMACMGEMIGNIAHQWRQPLSQISGIFLDIESAHTYNELDKKYLLTRINQANDVLEYMSKTIDDFKNFYHPTDEKDNFNLLTSVNNSLKIIHSSLNFNQINILINIHNEIHIKGSSSAFSQVILNLLSNAKDTFISKNIQNPKINIFSTKKENKIYLHVEDNGGGIEPNIIENIFKPYFTTKHRDGIGIGLYMSKIIIENKMNGSIIVNTQNDLTRFTIIFDIANI